MTVDVVVATRAMKRLIYLLVGRYQYLPFWVLGTTRQRTRRWPAGHRGHRA